VIALVNPKSTPTAKRPLPLSLLSLGSVLEGEHDYAIVDANLHDDVVARMETVAPNPSMVGVSAMPGPQLTDAVRVTRAIRRRWPGVPVVWGGYFPTQHAEVCLTDPAVDVCVRGQGEATFRELATVLPSGGALTGVAGISFREHGRIRHTPERAATALDDLPEPPFHRLPIDSYLHSHYLGRRVGAHQSSFGCPFACNFCAVVKMSHRRWLAQSPARVAAALSRQRDQFGIDAVQFYDMDFFISEARTAEIAERIAPLGLAWWALGRVDELMRYSDRTWGLMKASGLKMVFVGAESGSSETLKHMNKGGSMQASLTIDLVRRAREFGIVPELSFVVGNPPDPWADLEHTLTFIRRIKTLNEAAEIILYAYSPVPLDGTLYDEARAGGFRFPETLDEWVSERWQQFALRRDPRTPWLERDIRTRLRNFETVLNAYYPTVTDTRLTRWRRALLKAVASWRFHTECYSKPLELNALQRLFHYQRPETAGF
jgi:radical SAM superfamily enzyme YgiQ (UPF0313 family)